MDTTAVKGVEKQPISKNTKIIGHNIKKFRLLFGYSQEKIANDLYISSSYYREIEHGTANPTIVMLEKIADFFKIELITLLQSTER